MVSEDTLDADSSVFTHGRWRLALSLGEVGHIAHDDVEVVRAIRVAARDEDWNTFSHHTGPGVVAEGTVQFPITVTDDHGDPVARVEVEVRLAADCTVTARIQPTRELDVNRLGIVVLLAPALAGAPVEVEHPSGSRETMRLPERIAAHQPAIDIRALRYPVGSCRVTLELHGDVFEMEDQRNWTDASFKVYNRPLALPFPYLVGPGEPIEQSVRIAVASSQPTPPGRSPAPGRSRVPVVPVAEPPSPVAAVRERAAEPAARAASDGPRVLEIGTSSGRHVDGALPPRAERAGPLLVELTADQGSWTTIVRRARSEATALGVPVDLRIVAADADGLAAGLAAAEDLPLARIGVFDPVTHVPEAAGWDALCRWRDSTDAPIPLVAGTRAHFTELNRTSERLPRDADLVAFSLTPTMHATDPEHVEESLAMQALVARDAVAIAAGIPVVIGPVTFRRRFNAVATTPSPGSAAEAQRGIDPMIGSEYAAVWFMRSVAAVSIPGVLGGSWFEATGPRGLVTAAGEITPLGAAWLSLVS